MWYIVNYCSNCLYAQAGRSEKEDGKKSIDSVVTRLNCTSVTETKFQLSLPIWLCVDCRTNQGCRENGSGKEYCIYTLEQRQRAGQWSHDSVSRHCSHRLNMSDGRRGTPLWRHGCSRWILTAGYDMIGSLQRRPAEHCPIIALCASSRRIYKLTVKVSLGMCSSYISDITSHLLLFFSGQFLAVALGAPRCDNFLVQVNREDRISSSV